LVARAEPDAVLRLPVRLFVPPVRLELPVVLREWPPELLPARV
jgi:hypothetical protein